MHLRRVAAITDISDSFCEPDRRQIGMHPSSSAVNPCAGDNILAVAVSQLARLVKRRWRITIFSGILPRSFAALNQRQSPDRAGSRAHRWSVRRVGVEHHFTQRTARFALLSADQSCEAFLLPSRQPDAPVVVGLCVRSIQARPLPLSQYHSSVMVF